MSFPKWDAAIAEDVIAEFRDEPGPVLIALQAIQDRFGYVDDKAIDLIAERFNVSDRKSTRLNSSHSQQSRMPSSA